MKHKTIRMAGAIVSALNLIVAFIFVLSIAVGSSLADSGIPDDLLDDDCTPNNSECLDISGQTFLTETGRTRTVVFDIDGGAVTDPELWNPLIPGTRLDQGLHQSVMEPLFILNYATGVIEPWLGLSMTANSTMDVWTLVLRDGVKWSDGEDFDADDVVFTIRTLMSNAPALNWSNAISSSVRSVERLNKTTVRFVLNYPNPRFQLQIFTVYVGGSLPIVPAHIFSGQDPRTFKFYDPVRGWPVFTGPYKVQSVTHTEFIYVRDGNWWGAQAGWRRPPWPEKLVWL